MNVGVKSIINCALKNKGLVDVDRVVSFQISKELLH